MIEIANLNQFYGESHTLWDMNLNAEPGKITCVMGRNGVGKTTLMKSIMGLLPSSGSIKYQGKELIGIAPEKRAEIGIGYVPQGREIFSQLTVEENLKIGLLARKDKVKEVPQRIYELFPVLKEMLHRKGGDLSGGQQQQLAIGRALCTNPSMLILDEPGEGIQPNIVQMIGEVIQKLAKEENFTILLVEQKLPFSRKFADQFVIMERGRVVAENTIDQLTDEVVEQYLSV
ncbi:ABC transporter ATP-binding protein [Thiosulfatimonas sediminis]|uniref:ABC transporter ATP-binding protein n=1 Tax=Thiosulfatimonas sediminis TaxID=2675054 RepID=A0A6F8PT51_9GAMM|nr:urea ABC transporter ATP-binding subunit UrtE [Thiosulfatimonas sediminis]BBP45188.1 ABC transporter ATP-binding protein [Thiosulfatimonas sediminis]